ncbi:MAG: ATP-dependent Clp protease proteolytic subunit [Rheinheimera sp.]|nr:ATP-dependent Clp protease proteolytic subunit [Rheinheimera sp.]
MPNYNKISQEIATEAALNPEPAADAVRHRYLAKLHTLTQRNVICYYSGFLSFPGVANTAINDSDKNGFMNAISGIDVTKGLDLILHTPGGDIAATESIVDYLRDVFNGDVRAIIPQIAMSAGTMIACACNEIVMGNHSNLGPIDPQFGGLPAQSIIEEFNFAAGQIVKDPNYAHVWRPIIEKYHPTLLTSCLHAISWSKEMVTRWLETGMFAKNPDAKQMATNVTNVIADHANQKTHARHISRDELKKLGLVITDLESNKELQDYVLSIHHCFIHVMSSKNITKVIENHQGNAIVSVC